MTLNFDIGVWLWVTTPRDMLLFNLWSRSMTLAHCSQRFAINFKLKAYPVQQHFLSPLILKWQNTKVWARGDHREITYAIDKDVLTMKLVSWFKVTAHLLPTSTWSVKPNKALERKKYLLGKDLPWTLTLKLISRSLQTSFTKSHFVWTRKDQQVNKYIWTSDTR